MGTGYLDQIKQEAFEVNMGIVRERLVVLTWGNASSIDRANGIFAIKPSGVSYSLLKWQDMVLVDLEGNVINSKLKHMISDCDLIAKRDKSNFIWNLKFPINSLNIMRGYLFIDNETKDLYLNLIFDAYWKDNLDISNEEILKSILNKCKINPINFFDGIKDPKIKDELKAITQEAHDKEIFGTPTFVVNNKIFWGQDRLEFALDEYNK